jgi:hypothetical protein
VGLRPVLLKHKLVSAQERYDERETRLDVQLCSQRRQFPLVRASGQKVGVAEDLPRDKVGPDRRPNHDSGRKPGVLTAEGMHALRNPLNTRTVVVGGEHFLVGEDDTVVRVAGRPGAYEAQATSMVVDSRCGDVGANSGRKTTFSEVALHSPARNLNSVG